jgi:quercetin dioxygenase-like cupin family protein
MTTFASPTTQPKLSTNATCPELEWFGSKHWILLSGADTGGRMTLVEGIYPTGTGTPPHVHHSEDEMFEVIEGRFKFQAGDDFIEAGPGEVVWAPRDVKHSFTCISDAPGRLRFTVTPGGIEVMFAELAKLPAGPPDLTKVAQICARYEIAFV